MICPLRWASWPPAARSRRPPCTTMYLPGNCRFRAVCARCVARWRWRRHCSSRATLHHWCCHKAVPRKRRWCPASVCTGPHICWTWCVIFCLPVRIRPRAGTPWKPCNRLRVYQIRCIPIWPMSRARPLSGAHLKSAPPAVTVCSWSGPPVLANRCWRSALPVCCPP